MSGWTEKSMIAAEVEDPAAGLSGVCTNWSICVLWRSNWLPNGW